MQSVPTATEPEPVRPPQPAPPDDARLPADDNQAYSEILRELMATSVELTRTIRRNAQEDPRLASQASRDVDRLARTLRRCMLLAVKLREHRPFRATTTGPSHQARAHARAELQAARTHAPPDAGSAERLDTPERLDSLGPGTIPEILAGLTRDLEAMAARHGRHPASATMAGVSQAPSAPIGRPMGHQTTSTAGTVPAHPAAAGTTPNPSSAAPPPQARTVLIPRPARPPPKNRLTALLRDGPRRHRLNAAGTSPRDGPPRSESTLS